jgi:hypothetical protein
VRRVAAVGAISLPESGLLSQALAADARKQDLPLRFAIVGSYKQVLTRCLERAGGIEMGCYATDHPPLTSRHPEEKEILDLVGGISADPILRPAISPRLTRTR